MSSSYEVKLKGSPSSPYTRKMLAYLRYRRIPYKYLMGIAADKAGMPKPKVELLPTFYLPNAMGEIEAVTDSTPLIRRFERDFSGRDAIPSHPVLRFIDSLLEDFADEWLSKPMFHYRWHYPEDAASASKFVMMQWLQVAVPDEALAPYSTQFSARQVGRLGLVGSNPTTVPEIEAGYARLLRLLDSHFQRYPFLMGKRPGASDFAFFGQLSQMAQLDQSAVRIMMSISPRVFSWVHMMEDLSGSEPQESEWLVADRLPETLGDVLRELARGYLPVMRANAEALLRGAKEVVTTVEGKPWVQRSVPYQGKCLRWLRDEFEALGSDDKALATSILDRHGCLGLVQ